MNGDFSRLTFDPRKHYNGVLMQQGRVQLDSDWNEQQAIHQNRAETLARDVIGPSGAPKNGGGFAIDLVRDDSGNVTDDTNLTISPGRFYVEGVLCENEEKVALDDQPDLRDLALPTATGAYAIYLDVWERHLTTLEDPTILESALGGPDTTTRTKTVWQVRYEAVDPEGFGPDWSPQGADGGMLEARDGAEGHSSNGSLLPPDAGYTRLENQLYRVEVHRGGPRGTATFKWSRDNGSVVAPIKSVSGNVVTVKDLGWDEALGFAEGQWVEILEDGTELSRGRGELMKIDEVDSAERKITLSGPLPETLNLSRLNDPDCHPKLRRWDQPESAPADGVGAVGQDGSEWVPLESGIEVRFQEGDDDVYPLYRTGDYWLIPARTATGRIEWPPDPAPGPAFRLSRGTRHRYAVLALVYLNDGGAFDPPVDLRRPFPATTAITASDVAFDNAAAGLPQGTDDAQAALDALSQRRNNIFSFVITPEEGWESAFDRLAPGEDAHVGFQAGDYTLDGPLLLRNKGNITVSGCGPATTIRATKAESVFWFEDCESVILRDVRVVSEAPGSGSGAEHLNGAANFVRCGPVTVEGVSALCAGGAVRAASCVTVREAKGPIRIRGCDLEVGHQQVGLLLLGVERAQVEDNLLRASSGGMSLQSLVQTSPEYRAKMRRLLISNASLRAGDDTAPDVANVSYGGYTVSFKTDPRLVYAESPFPFPRFPLIRPPIFIGPSPFESEPIRITSGLTNEWQQLVNRFPPEPQPAGAGELLAYVKRLADRVLLNDRAILDPGGSFGRLASWRTITFAQHPTLASQGIVVVGGETVRDVRIVNNTIRNVVQGIHLGPSPRSRTSIGGNTVEVLLPPPEVSSERHGIFVADSDSLLVENNQVIVWRFESTAGTAIDGIRVYGGLGPMMLVRQNHVVGCTTGVFVRPVGPAGSQLLWLVADNAAPGTTVAVDAPDTRVRKRDNVPTTT